MFVKVQKMVCFLWFFEIRWMKSLNRLNYELAGMRSKLCVYSCKLCPYWYKIAVL